MRVTKEQQSAHSLLTEWARAFVAVVVDLTKDAGRRSVA